MYQIAIGFQPTNRDNLIDGRQITARGLHGLLFHVLKEADPHQADWLHAQPAPKPFSMVPFYTDDGGLAGLRYSAFTDEAARVLASGWQHAYHKEAELRLGRYQTFLVRHVDAAPHTDFFKLAQTEPAGEMALDFVSPTVFKAGPGTVPLPLPQSVFRTPLRVWEAYAGDVLSIPDDWLEWCERNVFIIGHRLETVTAALTRQQTFVGFVGRVHYRVHQGSDRQRRIWQALGSLLPLTGAGYRTTMGMGAVEMVK